MNNPSQFENQVRAALDVPEPSPLFMDSLRKQFVSGAGLTQKETKVKAKFSRLAWGFALLVLVLLTLAFFTSPTAVNALRRLLGYVPGVGVVEPSTLTRVLPAPITQTRDGVALTIQQVLAQPDQTIVVYRYVTTSAMLDHTPAPNAETLPSFTSDPSLRLPDGSTLKIKVGIHQAGDTSDAERAAGKSAVGYRMEFGPLPQDVDTVVLLLPRLIPIAPGAGPEFWEIPIVLEKSIGSALPVLEVVPTETEQSQPDASPTSPDPFAPTALPTAHPEASFVLDKVVPTADGYIFLGYVQWNLPVPVPGTQGYGLDSDNPVITDATGQEIPYDYVNPRQADFGRRPWGYQIKEKNIYWPVTIKTQALAGDVNLPFSFDALPPPIFVFDPGKNPQVGQTWTVDKSFTIAGYTTHVSTAQLLQDADSQALYYLFTMESPDGAAGFSFIDLANLDHSGHGGGGGPLPDAGPFFAALNYDPGQMPSPGPVQVGVFDMMVVFRGTWQVSWSPPGQ